MIGLRVKWLVRLKIMRVVWGVEIQVSCLGFTGRLVTNISCAYSSTILGISITKGRCWVVS